MNTQRLEYYRKRLQEQFYEVSEEIRKHSELDDSEIDSTILSSEGNLLEKIELALTRIDQGSYGKCMECSDDISQERLDAKPSVSLCTRCQENKEQQ